MKNNRSKEYQGSKRKAREKAYLERQKFKELTKEWRIRSAQNFDELFVALEMNDKKQNNNMNNNNMNNNNNNNNTNTNNNTNNNNNNNNLKKDNKQKN